MIIALIISSAVFFLIIYYLIFLKQKVPVEASKKFHLLGENLDDYLVRLEDSIPNLKKDLWDRRKSINKIDLLISIDILDNNIENDLQMRKNILASLFGDSLLLANFDMSVICLDPLAEEGQNVVDEYIRIICLE